MKPKEYWVAPCYKGETLDKSDNLIAVRDTDELSELTEIVHVIEWDAYRKLLEELSLLYSVISEYKNRAEDDPSSVEPECFSAYCAAIEMKRQREELK